VRFITLTPEGRDNIIIQVKYEKLPLRKEELIDTASSPLKAIAEETQRIGGQTARKQLNLSDKAEKIHPLPSQYISPRERKKARSNSASTTDMAGSSVECRRA
jgi:hypothetical protein